MPDGHAGLSGQPDQWKTGDLFLRLRQCSQIQHDLLGIFGRQLGIATLGRHRHRRSPALEAIEDMGHQHGIGLGETHLAKVGNARNGALRLGSVAGNAGGLVKRLAVCSMRRRNGPQQGQRKKDRNGGVRVSCSLAGRG